MANKSVETAPGDQASSHSPDNAPIARFVQNIAGLSNEALDEVADYLERQPVTLRMRFIERCANMISAVADPHAD